MENQHTGRKTQNFTSVNDQRGRILSDYRTNIKTRKCKDAMMGK